MKSSIIFIVLVVTFSACSSQVNRDLKPPETIPLTDATPTPLITPVVTPPVSEVILVANQACLQDDVSLPYVKVDSSAKPIVPWTGTQVLRPKQPADPDRSSSAIRLGGFVQNELGGLTVYGTTESELDNQKPGSFLTRYDPTGTHLWTRTIKMTDLGFTTGYLWMNRLVMDAANNTYILGYFSLEPLANSRIYRPFLLKVDPNGKLEWGRTMPDTTFWGASTNLTVDNLGNIWLVWDDWSSGDKTNRLLVQRYDSSGICHASIALNFAQRTFLSNLNTDQYGHIYLSGYSINFDTVPVTGSSRVGNFMVKLNQRADTVWNHDLNEEHPTDNQYGIEKVVVKDDSMFTITRAGGSYTATLILRKLDLNGKTLWSTNAGPTNPTMDMESIYAWYFEISQNKLRLKTHYGGHKYVGVEKYTPHYDFAVLQFDSQGKRLYEKRWDTGSLPGPINWVDGAGIKIAFAQGHTDIPANTPAGFAQASIRIGYADPFVGPTLP